jgi:hypothetical protein
MQPNFNNLSADGVTYLKGLTPPPCKLHWQDPDGHWHFWCPVDSATQGSSSSPRTEYRETGRTTNENFNWNPKDYLINRLEGTVVVRRVPSSQKVIFAQVHCQGGPGPFVKLLQLNQELRAEVRFHPEDSASPAVLRCPISPVSGPARANYSIDVTSDGRLIIILNGQRFEYPVDPAWASHPFYFKAGAYVIDNIGPSTEGGWVTYEHLVVIHQ